MTYKCVLVISWYEVSRSLFMCAWYLMIFFSSFVDTSSFVFYVELVMYVSYTYIHMRRHEGFYMFAKQKWNLVHVIMKSFSKLKKIFKCTSFYLTYRNNLNVITCNVETLFFLLLFNFKFIIFCNTITRKSFWSSLKFFFLFVGIFSLLPFFFSTFSIWLANKNFFFHNFYYLNFNTCYIFLSDWRKNHNVDINMTCLGIYCPILVKPA